MIVLPLAACGGGSASGPPTVNWYIGNEAWLAGSADQQGVIAACNAQANGKFRLKAAALPTNADGQHEQLVRRLAAKDSSIDLIGMDVTWTAEFAQAGWISQYQPGDLINVGDESKVLAGPWASAQWDGKQYGAPLNSNTRLLWYRKSLLGNRAVPQTWDQLISTAKELTSTVEETGIRGETGQRQLQRPPRERRRRRGQAGRQHDRRGPAQGADREGHFDHGPAGQTAARAKGLTNAGETPPAWPSRQRPAARPS